MVPTSLVPELKKRSDYHATPILATYFLRYNVKRKPSGYFAFLTIALALLLYGGSYAVIRVVKPNWINTPEGPSAAFRLIYYPVRYLEAEKPEWYSAAAAQDFWVEAKVDWINKGNGFLYFTWEGKECRAAYDRADHFSEGDLALLHFSFELVTWDDFRSRLVPFIDRISQPNLEASIKVTVSP
jgi:hypothetical protein